MTINSIIRPFRELVYLLFPPVCMGCNNLLNEQEQCVCIKCEHDLARLNFTPNQDNVVDEVFWGRVKVEKATAFFHFIKEGISQNLLHALKYKSRPDVGVFLGRTFANYLKKQNFFPDADIIVPVPLHSSRFRERGYNQSEKIVKGMNKALSLTVNTDNLYRTRANVTQTKKSKSERQDNVDGLFDVHDKSAFENKHILLVDDVITTGATLEACVLALQQCSNVRVSIACLAQA